MFEMSALRANTSTRTVSPFVDCSVNTVLLQTNPDFNRWPFISPNFNSPNFTSPNFIRLGIWLGLGLGDRDRVRIKIRRIEIRRNEIRRVEIRRVETEPFELCTCIISPYKLWCLSVKAPIENALCWNYLPIRRVEIRRVEKSRFKQRVLEAANPWMWK